MNSTPAADVLPLPHTHLLTRRDLAIAIALFLGTLALYWQVRSFSYLLFDDPQYISQNPMVQSGLNARSIRYAMSANVSGNWHPLTLLVEMLTVQLLGSSSGTLHLLSAFIHCASTVLLYLFLRLTTRAAWLSAITVMLWAWHPLRAESVAWVGELKDVLCGFFWLATMLAFFAYRKQPGMGRYLLVGMFMLLALLSKSMAVTLPVALMLLNVWPLKRSDESLAAKWWKKRLLEQLPLILLSLLITLVAMRTQKEAGFTQSIEHNPLPLRLTNALYSYLRYIGKELVPIDMGLIYPHPAMLGQTVPVYQWLPALAVMAAFSVLTIYFRGSKPYLLVGWFWFLATLLPVIGIVQLGEAAMADRYTYLPSIGLTAAIVWLIGDWVTAHRRWRLTFSLLSGAAAASLWFASSIQISYWNTEPALLSHSLAVIPDDFLAMTALSIDECSAGHPAAALGLARSAVQLVPENPEAHRAMANALAASGDLRGAFDEFETGIRLDPTQFNLRMQFGSLLIRMNRLSDAARQFQRATQLDPDSPRSHFLLAAALAAQGDFPDAIDQWKTDIVLDPHDPLAHGYLADALRLKGDRVGAIQQYRAALDNGATNPAWKTNLTWELAIDPATPTAELQAVMPEAKEATEEDSTSPFAFYAYSLALARLDRFDDAAAAATNALHLAEAGHQDAMAREIRSRLQSYRAGHVELEKEGSLDARKAPA